MSDVRGTDIRQAASSVHTPPHREGTYSSVCAVDLFCGAGGLTRGLEEAGVDVTLGVDIDSVCRYPYTHNNEATFLEKSIEEVTADDFPSAFHRASFRARRRVRAVPAVLDLQPITVTQLSPFGGISWTISVGW